MQRDYSVHFDGVQAAAPAEKFSLSPIASPVKLLPIGHPIPGPGTSETYNGTSGDDTYTGTSSFDLVHLEDGGNDTAHGLGDDDAFYMGAAFTAMDSIDGGDGLDQIVLQGDYTHKVKFLATTMTDVQWLSLQGNFNYSLKLLDTNIIPFEENDSNVQPSLLVTASSIGGGHFLNFDASAETNSAITVTAGGGDDVIRTGGGNDLIRGGTGTNFIDGGAGIDRASHSNVPVGVTVDLSIGGAQTIATGVTNTYKNIEDLSGTSLDDSLTGNNGANWLFGSTGVDTLVGSKGNDRLEGGGGADTLQGDRGDDHYLYRTGTPAAESTSTAFDTIHGADFERDHFETVLDVSGIDALVNGGTLSDAAFDDDLTAAVDGTKLATGHAVIFKSDAGDHAGETFLIVDANGTAGYQAGEDLVIRLEAAKHVVSLDTGDFIDPLFP